MRVAGPTALLRSLGTDLALMRAFRRSPGDFLDALQDAGADRGGLRVAAEPVLLLTDPAEVWELLTVHAKQTTKGRGMTRARLLLGEGLLTSEGDVHRQHRRVLQPAFHGVSLDEYLPHFATAAQRATAGWRDGQDLDLVAQLSAITLDAAGSALFGADLTEPAPRISAALNDMLAGFRLAMAPGGAALLRSPLPAAARVRNARVELAGVVDGLVSGRWATGAPAPVLEQLARHPELTDQQVRDEIMTLLLAGHETTAMALAWALIAIDHEPGVREGLEAEWDTATGVLSGPDPTRAGPRTAALVAETLRLWPPSWLFTRRVIEPVDLGERRLSPGLLCLISPALLHRNARTWAEPDRFRPDRWLRDGAFDHRAPGQPRGAYLPFGAGVRMCIGEQFAWVEMSTVLSELGRSWRLRIDRRPDPGPSSMTLRPLGPVRATVHRREVG